MKFDSGFITFPFQYQLSVITTNALIQQSMIGHDPALVILNFPATTMY